MLIITEAKLEEMDFLLSLAKEEGWNPGLYDADPFYHTDPNGFFIGRIGEEKVGCISSVKYNEKFGFLGLYIVLPKYRGRGFGLQLWNHALEYLGERTVGLDGVVAQQSNYHKSNFDLYYRNIRFAGKRFGGAATSLIDWRQIPFDALSTYDQKVFGLPRKIFLEHWIRMPNALGLAKMEKDRLRGYGAIRKCGKGYKIGPLFADDQEIAQEIYQGLTLKTGDEPVYIDVPEVNHKAMELVAQFHEVFETARMYNHPPPEQELDKVFGVTTFELG